MLKKEKSISEEKSNEIEGYKQELAQLSQTIYKKEAELDYMKEKELKLSEGHI